MGTKKLPVIDLAADGMGDINADWIKWRSKEEDIAAGKLALAAHLAAKNEPISLL